MAKKKLFLENIFVYGLGGIITKMVPFIMLPIVTRLMPNSSYYGLSDLSFSLVNLLAAVAGLGIYNVLFRFYFEKDNIEYKQKVCSTALFIVFLSTCVLIVITFVLKKFLMELFLGSTDYFMLFLISVATAVLVCINQIVQIPTRAQNKRTVYLFLNISSSIISYAIAIVLLLNGNYIYAVPLGFLGSYIYVQVCFQFLNHKWFKFKKVDRSLIKNFLSVSLPLMINALVYWLFSSCDKIMINQYLNAEETGIYSVGTKVAQISQLIYTAFSGGWLYYAFSTMKEQNQVESNSRLFEYLSVVSYLFSAAAMVGSKLIFKVVFTEEYLRGYLVMPYLFMSPLLQMMFETIANQFLVIKKTWPNMIIQISCVILNIVLNSILIPTTGIEGAAISTLISYIAMLTVGMVILSKMDLFVFNNRFVISTSLMIVFGITWRLYLHGKILVPAIGWVVLCSLYLLLYKNEVVMYAEELKKYVKSKIRATKDQK